MDINFPYLVLMIFSIYFKCFHPCPSTAFLHLAFNKRFCKMYFRVNKEWLVTFRQILLVKFCRSIFLFFYMKFIDKLVSIQHPVVIPKGALLNTHHPLSPPSHPPSTLSLFSVFNSLLCYGSFPL